MTSNKIKFGVGLFIILFFINISVVTYYILNKKGIFDKKYNYYFSAYSADLFNVGMPIKVSGFKIGHIDNIELKDDGSVNISFSVEEENRKWVLEKSIIMIEKPLLGSAQIILYPAVDNPILKEKSSLEVYESSNINEVIYKLKPIVEKIENIVTSVDKITSYLARDDSELVSMIKNLDQFTAILAKNEAVLTTITGDKNATDRLIETINQLPILMDNFNNLSSNVDKDILPEISKLTKELIDIAKDVKSKLNRLDGVVNSVGSYENDIASLKDDITTGIAKSNQILQKVDTLLPGKTSSEVKLP